MSTKPDQTQTGYREYRKTQIMLCSSVFFRGVFFRGVFFRGVFFRGVFSVESFLCFPVAAIAIIPVARLWRW
jgi:hypothetical protein